MTGYRLGRTLELGRAVGSVRGIAIAPPGLWVAGSSRVGCWSVDGEPRGSWGLDQEAHAVGVRRGRVWLGYAGGLAIFDPSAETWEVRWDRELLGRVTAIGWIGDDLFVGDAVGRCIRRFDRAGRYLHAIGDRHRKGGFHIPNGVVDFGVDPLREEIVVANPGLHRVERYRPDGESLGYFGRFDNADPAGFPGCCNPTNVAVASDGRIHVTEKASPRLKVYSSDGDLLEVVAGEEAFDPGCRNMDLAVDADGRIFVVDTARRTILLWSPASAPEPSTVDAG